MKRGGRFTTKQEAFGQRHSVWICSNCHAWYEDEKPRDCPCGCQAFEYFMSKREGERAAHLLMMQQYERISQLEFHPPFDFHENGIKIFTYRADFRYRRKGETVIEDVKRTTNPKGLDPVFMLKKKLIEARYGIVITIVTGR